MAIRLYVRLRLDTDVFMLIQFQKLRFMNAMWDETSRLDTVSPAGQLEAAEDDVLPAVPELNMPPRRVKK